LVITIHQVIWPSHGTIIFGRIKDDVSKKMTAPYEICGACMATFSADGKIGVDRFFYIQKKEGDFK